MKRQCRKQKGRKEGLTCQQPQDGGAGSAPMLLVLSVGYTRMTGDAIGSTDGSAESTGAIGATDDSAGSTRDVKFTHLCYFT